MSYLIKNGFMLNENGETVKRDIRITGEVISEIGNIEAAPAESVIDAEGLLVSPGLVDLHVHFREPGGEKRRRSKRVQKRRQEAGLRQSPQCRTHARFPIRRNRWNG